jgi:CspA family cold shock protein|tara:strand:- start:2193 stop:2402 length:210 start_codon:yes stop_codon:yes gene_type:complete
MPTGRVKWFDSKKGYGFIKVENSEKDVFLHVSALEKSKLRVLKENQKIQFEIEEEQGKLKAVNLKRSKD